MFSKNKFRVQGKTVVVTGGTRGMGLEVGRQLAEKGANVVVVARDKQKLLLAFEYIREGALHPKTQRFHQISVDLVSASEAVRVIDEVVAWNSGPPDIVWCCVGTAHPGLFIDTPVSELAAQVDCNYFTSLYMAHAVLTCWLRTSRPESILPTNTTGVGRTNTATAAPRHLIFTSSILAIFPLAGYSPYSPCKAALRALSDTLSQEMKLYAAAHPTEPPVRLHTIFPSTILGEAYDIENRIKPDVTKMLEAGEKGHTSKVIASRSIKGLESGEELITTNFTGSLAKSTMLGATVKTGLGTVLGDWILASVMSVAAIFVRGSMDKKVREWGRKFGDTGIKAEPK